MTTKHIEEIEMYIVGIKMYLEEIEMCFEETPKCFVRVYSINCVRKGKIIIFTL